MAKKSTRLEALHQIFEENSISSDTIELNDSLIQNIKKYAETVPDYRHPSYARHLLGDIIMIVFFALLGNANEWGEIESFAKRKEKWLRKYLELPYGIPTDDTCRIVMGNIDTGHFFQLTVQLLLHTINSILELSGKSDDIHEKSIVSVDGKESRGSERKAGKHGEVKALQILNVYSNDYGICLAQEFIHEKTNEIPAAQKILRLMDLKDTIVTADALNCQKKTVEAEHGGIATREYYITEDIGWFSESGEWKNLKSFGMVHKKLVTADGKKRRRTALLYLQHKGKCGRIRACRERALGSGSRAALAS